MSSAVRRPASVTFLVVLVWINALFTLAAGVVFLLGANNANVVDQFNGNADAARLAGWVLIVLGAIVALVAIGLANGSNFLRILLTVLLVIRMASDIWLILRSQYDLGALVSIAFAIVILFLLWNSRADAFFRS
jgi:hypothetical protein